jgi:hypothetical protein
MNFESMACSFRQSLAFEPQLEFPLSRDRRGECAFSLVKPGETGLLENARAANGDNPHEAHRDDYPACIASAWPALPPHIQGAILALVGPFVK